MSGVLLLFLRANWPPMAIGVAFAVLLVFYPAHWIGQSQ